MNYLKFLIHIERNGSCMPFIFEIVVLINVRTYILFSTILMISVSACLTASAISSDLCSISLR